YTIRVHNAGAGDAHDVVVTDELPAELEYLSASEEASYAEPGIVTWPPFDLPAGEERELSVTARVHDDVPAGTVVHNVAMAPEPSDPNPDDNSDDDRTDVERPTPRDDDPAPTPDDDPPVTWLPRTGLEAASWTAIGL